MIVEKLFMKIFNKIESYKHTAAIDVLKNWIEKEPQLIGLHYPVNTIKEHEFKIHGIISFVPDLTIFIESDIHSIFEVEHTHPVNAFKLAKIQLYKWVYKEYFDVYEIDAEWILKQVNIPYKLQMIKMI